MRRMIDETKKVGYQKFTLYLTPEKKALLERRYQEDGSRSLTAFIERAVELDTPEHGRLSCRPEPSNACGSGNRLRWRNGYSRTRSTRNGRSVRGEPTPA